VVYFQVAHVTLELFTKAVMKYNGHNNIPNGEGGIGVVGLATKDNVKASWRASSWSLIRIFRCDAPRH
jgi:hypothetical protein